MVTQKGLVQSKTVEQLPLVNVKPLIDSKAIDILDRPKNASSKFPIFN